MRLPSASERGGDRPARAPKASTGERSPAGARLRVVAAICALLAACPAQDPAPTLTRAQMAEDLRQLAKEAEAKWAYAEDRKSNAGVDLEGNAKDLIARLPEDGDVDGFLRLVREFVAAMQDGHAYVQAAGKEKLPFRWWPFTVVDTKDGLVIDRVLPTWTGKESGLTKGDVLLSVDGVAIEEVIREAERTVFASTPASQRRWALRSCPIGFADPRTYTVASHAGGIATFEAHAARAPAPIPWERDIAVTEPKAGVTCIRIPTFAHRDGKAWAEATYQERPALLAAESKTIRDAFARAQASKALILDLRGNGGGTDLLGMEVAACLLPKDSVYYGLSSRSFFGRWSKPSMHRLDVAGDPPRFLGKLIVLIDEEVFSTADNLCRCLDDLHPDVTFVGRPTGGGTGAPRPAVTLDHSGAIITFCTMRVTGPAGGLIEGRGTKPDVLVLPTREGVLAGRDEILEAALRLMP